MKNDESAQFLEARQTSLMEQWASGKKLTPDQMEEIAHLLPQSKEKVRRTKGRKKEGPMTWTLSKAGVEFGFDPKTVGARLTDAGQKPDNNGRFTTRQICAALYGDERAEKQKLLAEQIKHAALKNAKQEGSLIALESACFVAQRAAFAVKQRILSLSLPDDEKRGLLAEIAALAETDFSAAESEDDRDATESDTPSAAE